jgi:hypothetical protein
MSCTFLSLPLNRIQELSTQCRPVSSDTKSLVLIGLVRNAGHSATANTEETWQEVRP